MASGGRCVVGVFCGAHTATANNHSKRANLSSNSLNFSLISFRRRSGRNIGPRRLFTVNCTTYFSDTLGLATRRVGLPVATSGASARINVNVGRSNDCGLSVSLCIRISNVSRTRTRALVRTTRRIYPCSGTAHNGISTHLRIAIIWCGLCTMRYLCFGGTGDLDC